MDTARQVIRWALPGWVAFTFLAGFVGVDVILHGQSQPLYLEFLRRARDLVVPLGVATIPVGFLIYQLYYWTYWYLPVPSIAGRKLVDPVDRGREILSSVKDHVDFKQIFDNPLHDEVPKTPFEKWGPIGYKSSKIMEKYRQHWHLMDSAWYLALADARYKNTAEFLEKRNQMLGDIYHSLGACEHALVLAYFGYLAVFWYVYYPGITTFLSRHTPELSLTFVQTAFNTASPRVIPLAVNLAITFVVYNIFRGGRRSSFDALLALKHDVITNVMLDRPTKQNQTTENTTASAPPANLPIRALASVLTESSDGVPSQSPDEDRQSELNKPTPQPQ